MRFRLLGSRMGRGFMAGPFIAALGALAVPMPAGSGARGALASEDSPATGPTIAILATRPGGEHTSLYLAAVGAAPADLPGPVATFNHLAGAAVRAAIVPETDTVLAIADVATTRDASFNASLFKLAPHTPPERLCDDVVHGSRPLVTSSGRAFVARGLAGPADPPGKPLVYRVDQLSVDEVDLGTGATRTIHSYSGYLTFLAGSRGREVFLYRVGPAGADLVAVDVDSGEPRVILGDMPPYARDFSIDDAAGAIVFQERHETDSATWVVDRVDLATGSRERLHESRSMNLAPHSWPDGGVTYNPDGRAGLSILIGGLTGGLTGGAPPLHDGSAQPGAAAARPLVGPLPKPLGAGVDLVLATSSDRAWIAVLHTAPGALPVPFAISAETGRAAAVAAPPGTRVTIAGFVGSKAGAQ